MYVTGVVIDLATNFSPVESLKSTVSELCRERRRHSSTLRALQKLSEHCSFQVRRFVAVLLGVRVCAHTCVPTHDQWCAFGQDGWVVVENAFSWWKIVITPCISSRKSAIVDMNSTYMHTYIHTYVYISLSGSSSLSSFLL